MVNFENFKIKEASLFYFYIGVVSERLHTVHGRRISLKSIREKTLAKFIDASIIRLTQQDITLHLIFWSDHACVLNNGYLLLTMKTLYDTQVFFTNEEMLEKGTKVKMVLNLKLSFFSVQIWMSF